MKDVPEPGTGHIRDGTANSAPRDKERAQESGASVFWGLLLHFYQPPHQLLSVLRNVVEESYLPLIDVFRRHPHARATVNISGVLTDLLWDGGFREVIFGWRELAERGQIEFTGSAKYHPILPLIPDEERVRQVGLNLATNRRRFGDVYQPRGFFPPELAFREDIVPAVAGSGHDWMLLSGNACLGRWPVAAVHRIPAGDTPLATVFRDEILSNQIGFHSVTAPRFLEEAARAGSPNRDAYIVTAMDGETFGHHLRGWEEEFLATAFRLIAPSKEVRRSAEGAVDAMSDSESGEAHRLAATLAPSARRPVVSVTVSDIVDCFPLGEVVRPYASSWSASPDDIRAGNPFPLWDAPGNALHALLWRHLRVALEILSTAGRLADTDDSRRFAGIARALLDQAEHSCQWWWASRRPMWDINLIHRGLLEQQESVLNAARAVHLSGAPAAKKEEAAALVDASGAIRGRILDLLIET